MHEMKHQYLSDLQEVPNLTSRISVCKDLNWYNVCIHCLLVFLYMHIYIKIVLWVGSGRLFILLNLNFFPMHLQKNFKTNTHIPNIYPSSHYGITLWIVIQHMWKHYLLAFFSHDSKVEGASKVKIPVLLNFIQPMKCMSLAHWVHLIQRNCETG